MIEGNAIKFGYGDVAVNSSCFMQAIIFRQFKPCANCGDKIIDGEVEFIGDTIKIEIDYDDYKEFIKNLEKVSNKEISKFTFKDYIFDFENYNENSIKACRKHIDLAISCYIMCLAA